jgi:amino acid permease
MIELTYNFTFALVGVVWFVSAWLIWQVHITRKQINDLNKADLEQLKTDYNKYCKLKNKLDKGYNYGSYAAHVFEFLQEKVFKVK